jgi:N-acylneuraminate cytidylyltransferase
MRLLALIPARAGSKRLPRKNIRLLGGKPLIVWSIDVAKKCTDVCDILVSTDDPEIGAICKEAGAYVPWLRSAELATDTASSVDVALHALDWYENEHGNVDGILLLQPTSPFRNALIVNKGIEQFELGNRKPVIGVSPVHEHPMWMVEMDGIYLKPFMKDHGFCTRSQDLPPVFVINGSFYLISPTDLRKHKSFISIDEVTPLIIESVIEAVDIDNEIDWRIAQYFATT